MNAGQAVNDFRSRLLRFDAGAERILDAAKEFPDDPMVLLCAAAFYLYGQTNEANATAAGFLDRAEAKGAATEAPWLLKALRHWHALRYDAAAAALEEATANDPHNLLAAKFCEFIYYIRGQQFSGPRFLAHMERLSDVNGSDPDFLAMYSFAQELCGHFPQARNLAEKSLEIERRNPWAEHTLSHVTIKLGDIAEGEKRLRTFLPQAATCSRPIHSHTAWHLALFDVERLDHADALAILRGHIWGITPDMIGEQIDAIALLWRMEMAGADVASEWAGIADHVEKHVGECFMPFLSAHHAYALARAERTEAAAQLSATVQGQTEPLWQRVGIPVVEASLAHGRNDWLCAAELLDPVMNDMTQVGGSDAQDDLFRQMYFTALARGGRQAEARAWFERFAGNKKLTALDGYFLSLT